ncbi:hypothetical protein [Thermogymnomonas acidicola]|uniref:hypothetical protein n=1 Tax=Thermogymnomonas acidicola TaxID=399579 RepID=UPI0013967D7A|nr:hypothetical protein [Thermogymnomonas acidicola]
MVQDHLLQMIDMASGGEGVVFQGRRFSGAPRRYGERRIFQGGEQSNTSILFGREVMLKVIRRFTPGPPN